MKKIKLLLYTAAILSISISCEQDIVENTASPCPSDDPSIICPEIEEECPEDASPGSADFSNFIAMGTSYTAGFQAGALFNEGQENSLPAILANQFECVGGGTFEQPTIGTENGYNIFLSPNPVNNVVLGRLRLQGTPPTPSPVFAGTEAIPNPSVNASFMYAGDKAALNNFAVQAITTAQILTSATGNWGNPNPAVGFSPFYGRFASAPGSSTILGDAIAAEPTFFMFWHGMDDFMLYAAFGGDPTKAPLVPLDGAPGVGFANTYGYAVTTLLGSNAELKGVLGNFPNIFAMPHFRAIPWNRITLDAATAGNLQTNLANNYNAFLDAMVTNGVITAEEKAKRVLTYAAGNNPILLTDETLTDLSPYMQGAYAGLLPYARARHTTAADLIPFGAGAVLGTEVAPGQVRGVSVPLADQYVLIPTEITAIETARTQFNGVVANLVAANPTRLALADVNTAFTSLLTNQVLIQDNITLTPNVNPPTGMFSEDLLHPNSRGYAYLANIFIDAINAKFGSTIPKADLGDYKATGLPINP